MMAAQPFYHRATILFTTKDVELTCSELEALLRQALKGRNIIKASIEVEEISAQPGDPADL